MADEVVDTLLQHPERCITERKLCVACGSSSSRVVIDVPYSAPQMSTFRSHPKTLARDYLNQLMEVVPYRVVECLKCGLMWQPYVLLPEYELWLYSGETLKSSPGSRTRKWTRNITKFAYYAKLVERASAVFGLFEDRTPDTIRVLDFGAGWGEFIFAARAFGYLAHVAEINPDKQAYFQSVGVPCIEFPSVERFDFIYADQVFEHLSDPVSTLRMLRDHLMEPDGHIMIIVPTIGVARARKALAKGEVGMVRAIHPFEHINMFTQKALQVLGKQVGLEPVEGEPLVSVRLDRLDKDFISRIRGTAKELRVAFFSSWWRIFSREQLFRMVV